MRAFLLQMLLHFSDISLARCFSAVSFDFLFCLLATAVITLKRTVVKIFEMLRTKSKLVLRDGFAVANAPGQNNHCPTGWNDSRERLRERMTSQLGTVRELVTVCCCSQLGGNAACQLLWNAFTIVEFQIKIYFHNINLFILSF